MDKLYAPWREAYVVNTAQDKTKEVLTENSCPFCTALQAQNDQKELILGRYTHNFVIMNRFPYNGGHLMVIPYKHTGNLQELESDATTELMELTKQAASTLQQELKNDGANIGLNLGKAAGAGIPSHIHMHVLPRWFGDTNFLPILADVKLVSTDMEKLYQRLLPYFKK